MPPTPSDELISRLRRAVDGENLRETDLIEALLRYPLLDSEGRKPSESLWTGSWDMNAAAADLWEERASSLVSTISFSADGASFSASELQQNALNRARSYRARSTVRPAQVRVSPPPTSTEFWRGNLPEEDRP